METFCAKKYLFRTYNKAALKYNLLVTFSPVAFGLANQDFVLNQQTDRKAISIVGCAATCMVWFKM